MSIEDEDARARAERPDMSRQDCDVLLHALVSASHTGSAATLGLLRRTAACDRFYPGVDGCLMRMRHCAQLDLHQRGRFDIYTRSGGNHPLPEEDAAVARETLRRVTPQLPTQAYTLLSGRNAPGGGSMWTLLGVGVLGFWLGGCRRCR